MKSNNFTHEFFSVWSEESAYILGFWYADGFIGLRKNRHSSYKQFGIGNTDKQIMDDMSAIIGLVPCVRNSVIHKTFYEFRVNSDTFYDFCHSLIGGNDKTNSTKFPEIPSEYLKHFIRGYFDGDGSIHINHYKSRHGKLISNLSSSFTASRTSWSALNDLKLLLVDILGTSNRKISVSRGLTGRSKLSYGQYDTMLLCDWMYDDAKIFMERKRKIYDGFDRVKLLNSVKYFSNKM